MSSDVVQKQGDLRAVLHRRNQQIRQRQPMTTLILTTPLKQRQPVTSFTCDTPTKILYWSRCAVSMAIIAILTDSIDLYATSVAVASLIVRYFKHVGCQNYLQLLNYPFFCF